ncbi:MAG TPA: DMT family transporter, partial [Pontibacter sp.]
FGLLAALFYTIFLMVSGAAGNNLHPATKSALLLTGACILVFSIFPPVFLVNGSLFNGLFKWGLILSVFGTVLPPLLYAYGIPRVGLGLSAILSSAELPVAVMMSSLVLQEQVVAVQWCGVALILVAIALSNIGSLRRLRKQQNLAKA